MLEKGTVVPTRCFLRRPEANFLGLKAPVWGQFLGPFFGQKNGPGHLSVPSIFNQTATIPDPKLLTKNGLDFGTVVSAHGNKPSHDSRGSKHAGGVQL